MEFDSSIFKPYDIRGNISDQITPDIAYRIGNALVAFLEPTTIVVGCGVGRSVVELKDAVVGGIIDAGYRGEIHILLWNLSQEPIQLRRGERIAQLLILPVATPSVREVTTLDQTQRGVKGFGSTGK